MSASSNNPYIGLRPFEVDESILFFGRNNQTLELLQRLHVHHFVAVVGSSGCGKSSLIRAGLIPALKAGYLMEDSDHWFVALMKPGRSPIYNFAEAILSQLSSDNKSIAIEDLVNQILEEGAEVIVNLAVQIQKEKNINFLILVDQFEEIFRFAMEQQDAAKKDEAIDFVNIILELSQQKVIPFFVVITMRSDFIGDCATFYGLPEAMNESQYLVPRLNRIQLKTVIEGPAKLFGGKLDSALTSRILNDLGKVKDELPLLQHTLMRIWDHESNQDGNGTLDIDDYLNIGGLENALCIHADEALLGMSEYELMITKKIFQSLTAIDANGRRIRRPVLLSQLKELTGASTENLEKIMNCFVKDNRSFLIISSMGDSGDKIIDISHESFIRQWDKLGNWVQEEGESAAIYLQLEDACGLYQLKKKDLLAGSELKLMLDWRNNFKPVAVWANRYKQGFDQCIDYLDASEAEQIRILSIDRKRKQKQRLLSYTIIGLSLAVAIATGIATTILNKKNTEIKSALSKSQKLVNAFFFYDDKYALAFRDDKFYFIDKEGNEISKLGEWKNAQQFDKADGFARTSDNDINYLLDTNGNRYKVVYSIDKIDSTSEALDLSGSGIGNLPTIPLIANKLKILILRNNYLSSIPKEICQLENLLKLDLSRNLLDSLPREIQKLKNLNSLNLSGNKLKSLPNEILQLVNLNSLNLSGNSLDSLPRYIDRLNNLTTLDLSRNNFGSIPGGIFMLRNLRHVNLSGIKFLSLPSEIKQWTLLQSLSLDFEGSTPLPYEFLNGKYLKALSMSFDSIRSLPVAFSNFSNLSIISIVGNSQWNQLPDSIFMIRGLKKMELVRLNLVSIPKEIGLLGELSYLDLTDNNLTHLPNEIANLKQLREFFIPNNQLSALPAAIGKLSLLEVLNVKSNKLSSLPDQIGDLYNLTYIDMTNNQLKTLPAKLFTLKKLKHLYLSNNQIHTIEPDIASLISLKTLDLDSNRLSSVPKEIGNMQNLESLNLSKNKLQTLPKEISRLKRLANLDLSNNDLAILPFDSLSLKNLVVLDISGNPRISGQEIKRIKESLKNCIIILDEK